MTNWKYSRKELIDKYNSDWDFTDRDLVIDLLAVKKPKTLEVSTKTVRRVISKAPKKPKEKPYDWNDLHDTSPNTIMKNIIKRKSNAPQPSSEECGHREVSYDGICKCGKDMFSPSKPRIEDFHKGYIKGVLDCEYGQITSDELLNSEKR